MSKDEKKVFHCNVELTLDIIGGKWKPLIIHHMNHRLLGWNYGLK
jgi:DNA-binding HxlR family transcriptional regulator